MTTLGVALGVAVVVAIRLTNASSLGVRDRAEHGAGRRRSRSSVTVGVDETMLLAWMAAGVRRRDPRDRGRDRAVLGGEVRPRHEALRVLGVDILPRPVVPRLPADRVGRGAARATASCSRC